MSAWLLLLAGAAPPLPDPLPVGAVARLGHARMVGESYAALSVSPNGRFIRAAYRISGQESSGSLVWFRLADGKRVPPVAAPAGFRVERVFPAGSHAVSDGKRWLLFARAGDKAPRHVLDLGPRWPHFDPSGRWCIHAGTGEERKELHLADLSKDRLEWKRITQEDARWPVFSRNGRAAWVERGPDLVRVCDLATGALKAWPLREDKKDFGVGLALSPDGKVLATLRHAGTRLLDADTGETIRFEKSIRASALTSAEFTPDGKSLLAVDAEERLHEIPVDPKAA
ncbi:MAG: hypothetical protein K2W96_26035 [Gemmataceae bacterium]|nr:hypothetical protein [Gemmataceae bacterium]